MQPQNTTFCGLCEKPPFVDEAQTQIPACRLCFQLLRANGSIKVVNLDTSDQIVLSADSSDQVKPRGNTFVPSFDSFEQCIRRHKDHWDNHPSSPFELVNRVFSKEAEKVLQQWGNLIRQLESIIASQSVKHWKKADSKEPWQSSRVPSLKDSSTLKRDMPVQERLAKMLDQINSSNPKTLLSERFSIQAEFETRKAGNTVSHKRPTFMNRTHCSQNISKQSSRDSQRKSIPPRQLNNNNRRVTIPSIINEMATPTGHIQDNPKTQISWLIHNSNHNPQGFRDTSNSNTARQMTIQPMTECIQKALKLTASTGGTVSLVGFDVGKLAFGCYLEMMPWNSSTTTIKLVKVGLLDHQFNLLLCFAAKNGNLKNILVTNNHLTEESLQMLLNFVKKIKQIERVYLGNNPIKGQGCKNVVKKIKEHGVLSIYI